MKLTPLIFLVFLLVAPTLAYNFDEITTGETWINFNYTVEGGENIEVYFDNVQVSPIENRIIKTDLNPNEPHYIALHETVGDTWKTETVETNQQGTTANYYTFLLIGMGFMFLGVFVKWYKLIAVILGIYLMILAIANTSETFIILSSIMIWVLSLYSFAVDMDVITLGKR